MNKHKITNRINRRLFFSTLMLTMFCSSFQAYAEPTEAEVCASEGGAWYVAEGSGGKGFCYKKLKFRYTDMKLLEADEGTFDPVTPNEIIPQPETGGIEITGNYAFFGTPVSFYDGNLYVSPGSYSDRGYTFELAPDQWAISILMDFGTFTNVQAFTIVDVLDGGNRIKSIDSDGDGILGQQFNNGPFTGSNFFIEAVVVSAVPVPAAIWLFTSGLLGLGIFFRRPLV